MTDRKCPFSIIQAAGTARCRHAREVVRRGGSEYDCIEPRAHGLCSALVEHLNAVALPALGHEDDLTRTPKSVYERIMVGGLQGLRQAADPADAAQETDDIWRVVETAGNRYSTGDAIPAEAFVPAIENCRLKRRKRR